MGVSGQYFFDSYALIELTKGNPKYIAYADSKVTITLLNLIEFATAVMKDHGEARAREICRKFRECVADVDDETIIEAAKFREEHKRKRLSYADCIGYAYARRHGLRFLTGDEQFRTAPAVEFVKA
jgi:predicted nucleic acid-binding protein